MNLTAADTVIIFDRYFTLLFSSLLSITPHLSCLALCLMCLVCCGVVCCFVLFFFSLAYSTLPCLHNFFIFTPRFIITPPLPFSPGLPYSHPPLLFLTSTPPMFLLVIGTLRTISKRRPGHTVSDRQKPSMFTV